jgi:hypothetical protein
MESDHACVLKWQAKRTDHVASMFRDSEVAASCSRPGLLLAQTEHAEQRRRVKQGKQSDVDNDTCRDMPRKDD